MSGISKLSVAIADTIAEQNAFVVFRGFEESVRKASQMGYTGVELALCRADEIDMASLDAVLARYNMEVSAISTGQVFARLGYYLSHPDSANRDAAVEVLSDLVRLAKRYGKIMNIGRARGFVGEDQTLEQADALVMEGIKKIVDVAEAQQVDIIIEPLNRYETNYLNTLDECADFIRRVGSKRVGMMPDTFHMNIEDAHIGDSLIRNKEFVKYIHIADSNRRAPGWGHLDFDDVFAAIDTMQFDGWISVEILPLPDPDSAAKQAVDFVRQRYWTS
ncbi:MAG: TIM barrel protein [Christensenellales bacterium]